MEQLRRKMMKMVVMINVVSMLMMRTVRMTRPYVERASLRMSISSRTPSPPPAANVICEQPLRAIFDGEGAVSFVFLSVFDVG